MQFSVYDWHSGLYKYYETPDSYAISESPKLVSPKLTTQLGAAPEDAATKLPTNAKYVGQGKDAKGMIAVSGYETPRLLVAALWIGVAYILWKKLR